MPPTVCMVTTNESTTTSQMNSIVPEQQPQAPIVLSAFQRLLQEEGNDPNSPLNRMPPRHSSSEQFRTWRDRTPRVQQANPTQPRTDDLDLNDPIDRQILYRRNQSIHPIVNRPLQQEFNEIYQQLNWVSDVQRLIHGHAYCDTMPFDPDSTRGSSHQPVAPPPQLNRRPNIPIEEVMALSNGIARMNDEERYEISNYMKESLMSLTRESRTKYTKD